MKRILSGFIIVLLVLSMFPTTMLVLASGTVNDEDIVMFADYEEVGAESGFMKYDSGNYVATANAVVADNPLKSGINTSDKVVKIRDDGTGEKILNNFDDAYGDEAYPYKANSKKLITTFKLYATVGESLNNGSARLYGYGAGPVLAYGESFSVNAGTINSNGELFRKQLRGSNGNMTQWHEVMVIYDFKVTSESDTYKVYIDGELASDTTTLNNATVSGAKTKGLGFLFTANIPGSEQLFYLDDIKIQRVDAAAVNTVTASIADGMVNVDPKAPITLSFKNPVTADGVKAALTISEGAAAIAAERISVTLNDDSTVASVNVNGGLSGGETIYTLTLDKNAFADIYGCNISENLTIGFTTVKEDIVMSADYEGADAESGFKKYASGAYVTTANAVVTENPLKRGINTSDKVVKIRDDGTGETILNNFDDVYGDTAYPYKDKAKKLITSFKLYATVGESLNNGSARLYGFGDGPILSDRDSFSVSTGTINSNGQLFGKQLRESNGNMTEWHEVMVIYDFKASSESNTYKVYIDGELASDTTALSNPTVSGAKTKGLGFRFTANIPGSEQLFYLDDIKIQRVDSAAVNTVTASIADGTVNVDPKAPITLTFKNPVTADGVKAALTISEGGATIAAERISVKLNSSSTVATVKVNGGLTGGGTTYTLTLDKNAFADIYGCNISEDLTIDFTTVEEDIVIFADYEEAEAESGFMKYDSGNYVATANAVVTDNPLPSGINTSDKVVKITDNGTGEIILNNFDDVYGDTAYPYKDKAKKLITTFKLYAAVGEALDNGSRDYGYGNGPILASDNSFSVSTGTISTNGALFGKQLRGNDGNMTEWHEVMVIYDFKVTSESDTYKVYIDGELASDTTTLNNATVSGKKLKGLGFSFIAGIPKREQHFYLDDIKIQRVDAVNTVTANIANGAVDVDPKKPIVLDFKSPVTADVVKAALTISKGDDAIAAERIIVTRNADSTVVSVNVNGGLLYDKTAYTLTLKKDAFADIYGCGISEDLTISFTTLESGGMHIETASMVAAGEDLQASVTVKNDSGAVADAWVVVAAYKGNAMVDVAYADIDDLADDDIKTETLTLTKANGIGETYKVFIWDARTTLQPYHAAMPLTIISAK